MKFIIAVAAQLIVLLAVASAVALGVNAVRGKKSIDLNRVYYANPPAPPKDKAAPTPAPGHSSTPASAPAGDNAPPPDATAWRYPIVSLEEVRRIVEDPRYLAGEFLIVDARADQPFAEGHIPGAVQCDYYSIEYYIGDVLARSQAASLIIVYCNGGNCEDSQLVCDYLVSMGLPKDNIRLFKDGWEAWHASGAPIETGKEQS